MITRLYTASLMWAASGGENPAPGDGTQGVRIGVTIDPRSCVENCDSLPVTASNLPGLLLGIAVICLVAGGLLISARALRARRAARLN